MMMEVIFVLRAYLTQQRFCFHSRFKLFTVFTNGLEEKSKENRHFQSLIF